MLGFFSNHAALTQQQLQISKTSALTMSLLGILKSPVAIFASFLIWDTHIAFEQIMGYGLSLAVMMYHGLSAEALDSHRQQFNAWVGSFRSDSGSAIHESTKPVFTKAIAYLGSLITIEPKHSEVQRGRTGRRERTPRASPEKAGLASDLSGKGGESPSGKVCWTVGLGVCFVGGWHPGLSYSRRAIGHRVRPSEEVTFGIGPGGGP